MDSASTPATTIAADIVGIAYGESSRILSPDDSKSAKQHIEKLIRGHFKGVHCIEKALADIEECQKAIKDSQDGESHCELKLLNANKRLEQLLDAEMNDSEFTRKLKETVRKLEESKIVGSAFVYGIHYKLRGYKQKPRLLKQPLEVGAVVVLTIYLLMLAGTFSISWQQTFFSSGASTITDVGKEVDRSYGRFMSQYQFSLALIGISIWLLRRSVVTRLAEDVEKEFEKELKRIKEGFNENIDLLTEDIKTRNNLYDTVQSLLTTIPIDSYFSLDFKDYQNQKALKKFSTALAEFAQDTPSLLTVQEWILLGDSFCARAMYYRKSHHTSQKREEPEEVISNFRKAAGFYSKALDKQPRAYRALAGKGHALRMVEDYKDAIDCYDTVIDMGTKGNAPSNVLADVYVSKGLVLKQLEGNGGIRKGIGLFEKATKIDPMNCRAWYNLACYHSRMIEVEPGQGHFDEAIAALKKAAVILPQRCRDLAIGRKERSDGSEAIEPDTDFIDSKMNQSPEFQEIMKEIEERDESRTPPQADGESDPG
jgi:tetratricopeptide (TPR) repeat protein